MIQLEEVLLSTLWSHYLAQRNELVTQDRVDLIRGLQNTLFHYVSLHRSLSLKLKWRRLSYNCHRHWKPTHRRSHGSMTVERGSYFVCNFVF